MFDTYESVLAASGALVAPPGREGKLRCKFCSEWVADNPEDRRAHARQERLGMRRQGGRGPAWARNRG